MKRHRGIGGHVAQQRSREYGQENFSIRRNKSRSRPETGKINLRSAQKPAMLAPSGAKIYANAIVRNDALLLIAQARMIRKTITRSTVSKLPCSRISLAPCNPCWT